MPTTRETKRVKPNDQFTNQELVVIAAYLVGARTSSADTEDIAVKANEVAPGRFTWRKYPQQINIDTVRKRLWDAKHPKSGAYLLGSERDGWLLTANGVRFAKRAVRRLHIQSPKVRLTLRDRMWLKTERQRLKRSQAYRDYQSGRLSDITIRDANDFFRIDEYVAPELRARKIERYLGGFSEDLEMSPLVRLLATLASRRSK